MRRALLVPAIVVLVALAGCQAFVMPPTTFDPGTANQTDDPARSFDELSGGDSVPMPPTLLDGAPSPPTLLDGAPDGPPSFPDAPEETTEPTTTTTTETPTPTPTTTETPTSTPTTTETSTPTPTTTTTTTTTETPTTTTTTTPSGDERDPDDPGESTYRIDDSTEITSSQVETLIHQKVNDIRTSRGLDALSRSDEIASVSRAHSEDMHARDYFAHENPDGEMPWDRYDAAIDSPACSRYGENIAYNWVDVGVSTGDGVETYDTNDEIAQAIVDQWMGSSGHRANILDADYEREGLGVYVTSEGQVYATQNFCTPA